jgi:hypothetical protein
MVLDSSKVTGGQAFSPVFWRRTGMFSLLIDERKENNQVQIMPEILPFGKPREKTSPSGELFDLNGRPRRSIATLHGTTRRLGSAEK